MEQIHRRFTVEQVKVLLKGYCESTLERTAVEDTLGISKTRFFALLKRYRHDPDQFALNYERTSHTRLSASAEAKIATELMEDRALVEDPTLAITSYNYSALRDHLAKRGVTVSFIDRARRSGCYQPHSRAKAHDREVVTTAIGALIQHDTSHHRWSPFAQDKWVLITSLDDYSRKLLFADFFEQETTWAHIGAAEALMHTYGIPFRYYVDSLRVFRFVQGRDSVWRKHVLQTDEADTQWRQVMRILGVDAIFALSPQAKGKIERPYRWQQDRIVRTCAREKLTTIEDARLVLREEVDRYNNHQVHSTTKEIPAIRFQRAGKEGNSLFRPFVLPKPYTLPKDVFCLRETRTVNGYRRISLFNHDIEVPNAPPREQVEVHLTPDVAKEAMEIRIWWGNQMVRSVDYPLNQFPGVHF